MTSLKFDNCVESNKNYYLDFPITLDENKKYRAGLVYFSGWNNIHNIDNTNDKFFYSDNNGQTINTIKFIHGAYDINDLDKEIKRKMFPNETKKEYPINLQVFKMGSKVALDITDNKYSVIFKNDSKLNNLLGFKENKTYNKGYHIAENHANITHIQTIHIACDFIESNYVLNEDTKRVPIIYSFPAYTVPIGARIVEKPSNPRMYNVYKNVIEFVNIRIFDNKNNDINFNGEKFSLEIYITEY